MGAVQRPGLATEKPPGQIVTVPEIQITNLRSLDRDNADKVPRRHLEATGIPRRNIGLRHQFHPIPRQVKKRRIKGRQGRIGITDHPPTVLRASASFGAGWSWMIFMDNSEVNKTALDSIHLF